MLDKINARKILSRYQTISLVTIEDIPEYVGHPQMTYGEEYFMAGHARNVAIEYAVDNGFDIVIFIDGDCMPEPDFIKSHAAILSIPSPCTTVGKRKEAIWGYDDQRMVSKINPIPIFHGKPTNVTNEFYFVDSGVLWTCNFGMNIAAISALYGINERLYGRREVFSSDFSGTWGGEDGFIGLECLYCKIPVYALEKGNNGVRHKEHPRPTGKYDHITFIDYLEERREDLLFRMGLFGMEHPEYKSKSELAGIK